MTAELRPFDEEDWYAFAGCESETPLVAYHRDFTMVVDGTYVEVYLSERRHGGVRLTGNFTWKFPDHGTALLFALDVRGTEPDDILDLKARAAAGSRIIAH